MIMRVYALRDVKVGFLSPTVSDSDAIAIRNLENVLRSPSSSLLDSHPEDFSLYCLGSFDTTSGVLSPLAVPELIVEVRSLL
ncbi:nonstructural protein [Peromfec virus RodF8_43]|uniref:Nonstructural protein n=1 Tax=Peromfec virus RodF8_43 TaxID=2929376 RepID=A0A976R5H6_9VIRU|nr:nonstructural protein [Peromfec virus RodF8_43]